MKPLLLLIALWACGAGRAAAQSLDRQVIGAAGASAQAGAEQLSWTLGQPAAAALEAGAFILTQGFQQGDLFRVSQDPALEVQYRLYPNPVSDLLWLELSAARPARLLLRLSDAAGRELEGFRQTAEISGSTRIQLDLSQLPEAVYFLSLHGESGGAVHTFRIQRIR